MEKSWTFIEAVKAPSRVISTAGGRCSRELLYLSHLAVLFSFFSVSLQG
jgi:hypothetical protein